MNKMIVALSLIALVNYVVFKHVIGKQPSSRRDRESQEAMFWFQFKLVCIGMPTIFISIFGALGIIALTMFGRTQ